MAIPGVRWGQELGRIRTALALALQLRAKSPTSPALLPSIPVLLQVAHSDLGPLPSPTLVSVD